MGGMRKDITTLQADVLVVGASSATETTATLIYVDGTITPQAGSDLDFSSVKVYASGDLTAHDVNDQTFDGSRDTEYYVYWDSEQWEDDDSTGTSDMNITTNYADLIADTQNHYLIGVYDTTSQAGIADGDVIGTWSPLWMGGTVIDGARINTGTITADEIAAGTITAAEIEVGALTRATLDAEVVHDLSLSLTATASGTIGIDITDSAIDANTTSYSLYRRKEDDSMDSSDDQGPSGFIASVGIGQIGVATYDHEDVGLEVNRKYYYSAAATDDIYGYRSDVHKEQAITTSDTQPPSFTSPTTTATGELGRCVIEWTKSDDNDIDYYQVTCNYAKDGATSGGIGFRTVGNYEGTTAVDYNLSSSTGNFASFDYQVTAFDYEGNSTALTQVSVDTHEYKPADGSAPDPVNNVAASSDDDGRITLTWNANTEDDLSGYEIHRSDDDGTTWESIATVGTQTQYTDTGLKPQLENSQQYDYRVYALDYSGNRSSNDAGSSVSNVSAIDTTAPVAPQPSGITGDGFIDVIWGPSMDDNAVRYYVYSNVDYGEPSGIIIGPAYTKADGALAGNTFTWRDYGADDIAYTYNYKMKAEDNWGNVSNFGLESPIGVSPGAPGVRTMSNWATTGQTTIDGGKITADSVTAAQIAANTITANEITVGGLTRATLDAEVVHDISLALTATTSGSMGIDITDSAIDANTTGYDIYRRKEDDSMDPSDDQGPSGLVAYIGIGQIGTSAYDYEDVSLEVNRKYHYSAAAVDTIYGYKSDTSKEFSDATVDTQPPSFTSPSTTATGELGRCVIEWTKSDDDDIDYYQVTCNYAKDGDTSGGIGFRTVGNYEGTTAVDFSLSATEAEFANFDYQVTAYDYYGNSTALTQVSVTPHEYKPADGSAPGTPGSVAASSDDDGRITVTWTAPSDNDLRGYEIHRSDDNGSTWESLALLGPQLQYTDTGLKPNLEGSQQYDYRVYALDYSGNRSSAGSVSNVSAVDTTAPVAPQPTGVPGDGFNEVIFGPSMDDDAVRYYIFSNVDYGEPSGVVSAPAYTKADGDLAGNVFTWRDYGADDIAYTYNYKMKAEDKWGNVSSFGLESPAGVSPGSPGVRVFSRWATTGQTTIDGGNITADTVTAGQIAAGTITATEIAAGTITTDEIAANTITADDIAATTITLSEVANNTLTGAQLDGVDMSDMGAGTKPTTGLLLGSAGIQGFQGTAADADRSVFIDVATGDFTFGKVKAAHMNMFFDASDGVLQFRENSTVNMEFSSDTPPTITVGPTSAYHTSITSTKIELKSDASTVLQKLEGTTITLGNANAGAPALTAFSETAITSTFSGNTLFHIGMAAGATSLQVSIPGEAIWFDANNSDGNTPYLTIDSSGLTGGTTSTLTIKGNTTAELIIWSDFSNGTTADGIIHFKNRSSGTTEAKIFMDNSDNDDLKIGELSTGRVEMYYVGNMSLILNGDSDNNSGANDDTSLIFQSGGAEKTRLFNDLNDSDRFKMNPSASSVVEIYDDTSANLIINATGGSGDPKVIFESSNAETAGIYTDSTDSDILKIDAPTVEYINAGPLIVELNGDTGGANGSNDTTLRFSTDDVAKVNMYIDVNSSPADQFFINAGTSGGFTLTTTDLTWFVSTASPTWTWTAATQQNNNGAIEQTIFGDNRTVGDQNTTVCTFATASNTAYIVTCELVGMKSTNDESASYKKIGTYINNGGTVSLESSVTTVHSKANVGLSTCDMDIVISGTNILLQADGKADDTIYWSGKMTVMQASD
jgi:hypothetical protein